jgi:hypothetical protein
MNPRLAQVRAQRAILHADTHRREERWMSDTDQAITALVTPERGAGMLAGLLLGTLAGAAAAALLATQGGAATRELLSERGLELKDRAEALLRSRRSPL